MPPKNVAQVAITANASGLPSGLRQAVGMLNAFSSNARNIMSKIKLAASPDQDKKRWWVGHAAGTAVGMGVARGIDTIIDQGREVFDFEEKLVRLGITASISGQKLRGMGQQIRRISGETGTNAVKLIEAADAYAGVAGASALSTPKLELMARAAQASNTPIATLAQVVFQLQHSMKISDSSLEDTLGGIISTSKEGAVHFNDMAHEIAELAPQAARFGLVGRDGVNKLTAMMQVARTGFGSVSEMGTGITRVFAGLTMHADDFESYGVKIFDKDPKTGIKTWRHFSKIFGDIMKNKHLFKDPFLLRKAFGRSEADRTMRLWMEGVKKMEAFELAGMDNGAVERDINTYLASDAGKITSAFEMMKNSIAEAFTPERIAAFTRALEGLGAKLGPVVEGVGKVGDTLNVIYEAGKKVRGFLSDQYFDDFRVDKAVTKGRAYAKGITEKEAYEELRKEGMEAAQFKQKIADGMKDDRTTKDTDKMAVAAAFEAKDGSMLRSAANNYLDEVKMPKSEREKMWKDIQRERLNMERAKYNGEQSKLADVVTPRDGFIDLARDHQIWKQSQFESQHSMTDPLGMLPSWMQGMMSPGRAGPVDYSSMTGLHSVASKMSEEQAKSMITNVLLPGIRRELYRLQFGPQTVPNYGVPNGPPDLLNAGSAGWNNRLRSALPGGRR